MELVDVDVDSLPAPKPVNMENFGELQYIMDKLSVEEQLVVTEFFVHGTPKVKIARLIDKPVSTVNRILRSLCKFRQVVT